MSDWCKCQWHMTSTYWYDLRVRVWMGITQIRLAGFRSLGMSDLDGNEAIDLPTISAAEC